MYLITLQLDEAHNSLESVQQLSGINALQMDQDYGIVLISPKRQLYVIRVLDTAIDSDQLMAIQPCVKGVHGDVPIAPFAPSQE